MTTDPTREEAEVLLLAFATEHRIPGVDVLLRELQQLRTQYVLRGEILTAAIEERNELRALFDLQHSRIVRATELWRAEAPEERALMLPDLGKHIDWLIERGDKPLAALEALRNVPAIQRTLDWWSDMTSEEYSAKWGTGDTSGDEEAIAEALCIALGVKSHAEP